MRLVKTPSLLVINNEQAFVFNVIFTPSTRRLILYTLASIEKFLRNNADLIGQNSDNILKRAMDLSTNGILPNNLLLTVMQDTSLAINFHWLTHNCPEHAKCSLGTLIDNLSKGPV